MNFFGYPVTPRRGDLLLFGSPEPGSFFNTSIEKWRRLMSTSAFGDVRFLTVAEVAGVMRVSKMTVYRLVHSGDLTAVRVGRSFRVPEQAVQDYLRDSYIETA